MPLFEKIRTIAKEIYRAKDAAADKSVKDQLASFEQMGYGKVPICIAKTQYSFSTNPDAKGAPVDHTLNVREVRLSAGAEFVVAICGEIMSCSFQAALPRIAKFTSMRRSASVGLARRRDDTVGGLILAQDQLVLRLFGFPLSPSSAICGSA